MRAVQVSELAAEFRSEHAVEGTWLRFKDRDRRARGTRGCGRFQADPPGADDHDAGFRGERGTQGLGLRQGPQVKNVAQACAWYVDAARRRTGREHQLVVAYSAAAERHQVRGRVDHRDGDPGAQVDVVLGVPAGRMDEGRLSFFLAEEVALGERRSFVRAIRFAAEEHHLPVKAFRPERLCRLSASQPASHDHERRHLPPPIASAIRLVPNVTDPPGRRASAMANPMKLYGTAVSRGLPAQTTPGRPRRRLATVTNCQPRAGWQVKLAKVV